MKRWVFILAFSFVHSALTLLAAPEENLGRFAVAWKVVATNTNECTVRVTVTNSGQKAVRFHEADLPWHPYSNRLVLALLSDDILKTPIERALIAADPIIGTVSISPGKSLTGEVNLRYSYPTLIRDLSKKDVLLFWSYKPVSIRGSEGERLGGFLVIPKL